MKALFLTPIEENKEQQFLDTGITCIFKEKKSVTKEDFKDIDIVFGNPDLDMIKDTSIQWIQLDSAGANAYCSIPDSSQLPANELAGLLETNPGNIRTAT